MRMNIPKLDETLSTALPKGFLVLVAGSSGSGTELFAKQFSNFTPEGNNVIYITTEEQTTEIKETMAKYNWNKDIHIVNIAAEYYEEVLSKELQISKYRQEGINIQDIHSVKGTGRRRANFLTKMLYEIGKAPTPFSCVIDTLDFFLQHYDQTEVLSVLRTIRAHAQHFKSEVMVTMMRDTYAKHLHREIEGIADCIIELEKKEKEGKYDNYLRISKVINHPEKNKIHKYEITPQGFSVSE